MTHGKIILGAIAFVVSAASTLAFKPANSGAKQLFTRSASGTCTAKLCFTRAGAAGNSCSVISTIKLYTLSSGQCTKTYTGPRTVNQ